MAETMTPSAVAIGPQRFVLRGADWTQFRKFADALDGRHVRLTYDRGVLERIRQV